jgi:hypothetical protein
MLRHIPALGNLSLVWSVLSVPPWVLKHIPLDNWGEVGVVVAHANVRLEHLVLLCYLPVGQDQWLFQVAESAPK